MSEGKPYTVRLSSVVREKVQEYCAGHGLKQGYFVEKALIEKLERESDVEELKRLKPEEKHAKPFRSYLKRRRV